MTFAGRPAAAVYIIIIFVGHAYYIIFSEHKRAYFISFQNPFIR